MQAFRGNLSQRDASKVAGISAGFWNQLEKELFGIDDSFFQGFKEKAAALFPHYIYAKTNELRGTYGTKFSKDQRQYLLGIRGNLTQHQAGLVIGVTNSTWCLWETEERPLNITCLADFRTKAKEMFPHYRSDLRRI